MCKAVMLPYAGMAVFKVKIVEADDNKQMSDLAMGGLVVKLSWQLKDQRSEAEILEHLHKMGISSVPYMVVSEELAKMKEGVHNKVQGIIGTKSDTDHRIY